MTNAERLARRQRVKDFILEHGEVLTEDVRKFLKCFSHQANSILYQGLAAGAWTKETKRIGQGARRTFWSVSHES